ncbi:hypothetical protein [uncultured Cedecea sp.]|uniref:hypothetical protein n=1 Tax=uncultured Cedecea sp. TaxID=988762 RepID=UPI00262A8B9C|nr:hypothetical protein [uncultured Cedecea sp.]
MHASFTQASTESRLNGMTAHTSPSNNTSKNNGFMHNVSFIENSHISLTEINTPSSPLKIMGTFFKKLKCILLEKTNTLTPVDNELNSVLSQGRILSEQSDNLQRLLNDKPDVIPPSLSLTTKTGIVLGGILLTSAITTGSIYYLQRTSREQRNDDLPEMTNRDGLSSMSLSPYNLYPPLNTHSSISPYYNISETQDIFLPRRRRINIMIKSAVSDRQILYKKNINKTFPCPPVNSKQKIQALKSSYIYTIKQSEICLTDAFHKNCQRVHNERMVKRNCHDIPKQMVLKIRDIYCLCPPPDWLNIKVVTPQQVNNIRPCPSVNDKKKTKLAGLYIYTTKQPEICLTDSFNKMCQTRHRERTTRNNCHELPSYMVLKLAEISCMCLPPDWFEVKMREPTQSEIRNIDRKKYLSSTTAPVTTTHSIIPIPKDTHIALPVISSDNEKTIKNRTHNLYEYRLTPKINHTIISGSNNTENLEEVQKVSTLDCYHERENLTNSRIARIISQTIYNPLSTLFNEGRVIIQYNFFGQGCLDNTQFYETSKKIESVIETFLSFLSENKIARKLDRLRFATRFIAGLLELYADHIEGKKGNADTILNISAELLGLAKDMVSSILIQDIERISKNIDDKEIKEITESLSYQNDDLVITDRDGNIIKVQRDLNHLYDPVGKGFIFYDHQKKWYVDSQIESNNYIRKTIQRATEVWKDHENIFFYKNSAPEYYGENIIIKYNNDIYALIGDNFQPINEISLIDTVFIYTTKNKISLPVARGENGWVLEAPSSYSSSMQLQSFIKNNKNIKNALISKYINHQDVSPFSPDSGLKFDKNLNNYLKINNEYFLIKKYQDTSYYIESPHSTLALQMVDNQYHIKESFFDELCCFHKEPLSKIPGMNQDDNFFLDNSIIRHVKSDEFLSNDRNIMTQRDIVDVDFLPSPHIEGAISNSGNDYFYYDNMFIHIYSNNDGTYTIGDINDKNNILAYKNAQSTVYFKIPKSRGKWQGLKEKKEDCIVRRQPLSTCTAPYFETSVVNYLVNNHIDEGITIDNPTEQLEPYAGFRGIYRARRGDRNSLYYYTGVDNIYLHASPPSDTSSYIVPVVFTLHGKDSRQQINRNVVISNISIVKDFDTKKIVICTPEEAQEYILDIKRKEFSLHLEWQGGDQIHPEVTAWELEKIHSKMSFLNDLSSLDELFNRTGKKIITAPEKIDQAIKASINMLLHPSATLINSLKINSLKDIVNSNVPFVIKDICDQAFKKTIYNINEAIITMKHSSRSVNNYITHALKISDNKAREKFFVNLEKQLEMMKMIFDEKHKESIMIISKVRQKNIATEVLSDKGKATLGFNLAHDPLDRIYINTAMMNDFSETSRLSYINMISDTMLHEAVHALGKTEDYVYLPISEDGHISEISTSIAEIEESIAWEYTENMNIEYLSRLFFLNHPLYNKFSISSLVKASNLLNIFRNDPYYRSIIFLNNPDTISVIVRELAQFAPD